MMSIKGKLSVLLTIICSVFIFAAAKTLWKAAGSRGQLKVIECAIAELSTVAEIRFLLSKATKEMVDYHLTMHAEDERDFAELSERALYLLREFLTVEKDCCGRCQGGCACEVKMSKVGQLEEGLARFIPLVQESFAARKAGRPAESTDVFEPSIGGKITERIFSEIDVIVTAETERMHEAHEEMILHLSHTPWLTGKGLTAVTMARSAFQYHAGIDKSLVNITRQVAAGERYLITGLAREKDLFLGYDALSRAAMLEWLRAIEKQIALGYDEEGERQDREAAVEARRLFERIRHLFDEAFALRDQGLKGQAFSLIEEALHPLVDKQLQPLTELCLKDGKEEIIELHSAMLDSTYLAAAQGTAVMVMLTFLILFFSTRWVRGMLLSLKSISKGIEIIREGRLQHRLEVNSRDELGQIASSFNEMTVSLQQSEGRLREEIRVRAQAEAHILEYNRKLEEANRMKDLFTDIMGHDLLTPVAVIQGLSKVVAAEEPDARKKDILDRTVKASDRLLQLVRDASTLSRLEKGESIEFGRENLEVILRESAEEFASEVKERGICLFIKSNGASIASVGTLIRDVFTNLISNAIKYGEGKQVEAGIRDEGDAWVVYVKDWGNGIPDEDKNRIFRRFERIEKEGVRGHGLGLTIATRIVHLHGGRIWVEDNPEGGSVFLVSLTKVEGQGVAH